MFLDILIALGLAAAMTAGALLAAIALGAAIRRAQDDPAPETQDDFHQSLARWGHLRDRRDG
jgi:hypothetical protein